MPGCLVAWLLIHWPDDDKQDSKTKSWSRYGVQPPTRCELAECAAAREHATGATEHVEPPQQIKKVFSALSHGDVDDDDGDDDDDDDDYDDDDDSI